MSRHKAHSYYRQHKNKLSFVKNICSNVTLDGTINQTFIETDEGTTMTINQKYIIYKTFS